MHHGCQVSYSYTLRHCRLHVFLQRIAYLTTRTTYHVMYEGSPVRDASIILVNWSGISQSCDCLPNMSVLQHTAIVAEAYHTVIKGVPELNWNIYIYTHTYIWAQEPVWTQWLRENFASCWYSNPDSPTVIPFRLGLISMRIEHRTRQGVEYNWVAMSKCDVREALRKTGKTAGWRFLGTIREAASIHSLGVLFTS
jgi:hypothetical protein